jgi:hypothetical protein
MGIHSKPRHFHAAPVSEVWVGTDALGSYRCALPHQLTHSHLLRPSAETERPNQGRSGATCGWMPGILQLCPTIERSPRSRG